VTTDDDADVDAVFKVVLILDVGMPMDDWNDDGSVDDAAIVVDNELTVDGGRLLVVL
jgi:hypothetical protein